MWRKLRNIWDICQPSRPETGSEKRASLWREGEKKNQVGLSPSATPVFHMFL